MPGDGTDICKAGRFHCNHGFSILIGATHTPSSRLYAAPTAVRTNKNDGAFSSLFWTILSRSLLRLSAPSLIRSSPLTQGKV